jgi:hypothetical protein
MIRHYCTYFDQRYLLMGLTLYHSLLEHAGDFKLWVLCFDEETYHILERMRLQRVELICLSEFENQDLLNVKNSRTPVEYYWTSTPDLPLYVFGRDASVPQVTYLDADLFFFAPPNPIEQEMGEGSILIVEHRYPPDLAYLAAESGIYNVSLLSFRRDANALACLNWWRARCLEWCYVRVEDGKMGDQKYLDDWPQRFSGVVVLKHVGCGVAPWNIQSYQIHRRDGAVRVDDVPLIFYHFHQFRPLGPNQFDLAQRYRLSRQQIDLIYRPYIAAIQQAIRDVQKVEPGFRAGYFSRDAFMELKRIIKRHWHILTVDTDQWRT